MPIEPSPAFQFYVKEWRSSRAIMRMTFAQRGMYLEMLLEQWENLSLPDSPEAVAEIVGGPVGEWKRNWPTIRRSFLKDDATGRISNTRLEKERAKQKSRSKRATDIAQKAAAARWKREAKTHESDASSMPPASPADAEGMTGNAIAFALPIPITPNPLRGPSENSRETERSAPRREAHGSGSAPRREPTAVHVTESVAEQAGRFLDDYQEVYREARNGAFYAMKPARDHAYACQLVVGWPDRGYLRKMAELFLRMDVWKPKNQPGTVGQFLHMAPQCDTELRKHDIAPRGSKVVS